MFTCAYYIMHVCWFPILFYYMCISLYKISLYNTIMYIPLHTTVMLYTSHRNSTNSALKFSSLIWTLSIPTPTSKPCEDFILYPLCSVLYNIKNVCAIILCVT